MIPVTGGMNEALYARHQYRQLSHQGTSSAPLDLLIAAHALAVEAILVTNDGAFGQLPDLLSEDWTIAFPS